MIFILLHFVLNYNIFLKFVDLKYFIISNNSESDLIIYILFYTNIIKYTMKYNYFYKKFLSTTFFDSITKIDFKAF